MPCTLYNNKRYDVKLNYLNKRISVPKCAVYQTFRSVVDSLLLGEISRINNNVQTLTED